MPDPFATLGLEPAFDLDKNLLQQRYLAATAANHPDRFTDPLEQADAMQRSAAVNEAFATLSDAEARANALLVLRGGPSKSDDKSLPPTLLMDVMELREELEQAVESDDDAAIGRLRAQAQDRKQQHQEAIARLFEAEPFDPAAVRLELNAMRYMQRMLDQMDG